MIDTIEFSNFIGGFQFALLSQSLLCVAISKPALLVIIMHISVILGIMNIFSQNITYVTKTPEVYVESDEKVDEADEAVEADEADEAVEAEEADEADEAEEAEEVEPPKAQDNINLD
jgi:hypothetical protein